MQEGSNLVSEVVIDCLLINVFTGHVIVTVQRAMCWAQVEHQ